MLFKHNTALENVSEADQLTSDEADQFRGGNGCTLKHRVFVTTCIEG